MVQYYYERYNANSTNGSWTTTETVETKQSLMMVGTHQAYSSVSYSESPGYTGSGSANYTISTTDYTSLIGKITGISNGSNLRSYWKITSYAGVEGNYIRYNIEAHSYSRPITYSKGTYVDTMTAEDGTYPANGRHTDGYWYVKGVAVGPLAPGTVINKQYNLRGAEARRLIRLANGTLIATTQASDVGNTHIFAYKSTDEGRTWTPLANIYSRNSNEDKTRDMYWSVVALGNEFGLIAQAEFNKTVEFIRFTENGIKINSKYIYNGNQSATVLCKGVSIALDPQNQNIMHVTWSIKDNNSHNLFYSKTVDGGINWSAPEKLTQYNSAGQGYLYPSIVCVNGKPVVISYMESTVNSQYVIDCRYWDGSKWLDKKVTSTDTTNIALKKGAPSSVVDKNGTIHVTWEGPTASSVKNNIHYISSVDGGVTWTSYAALTNVSGLLQALEPSITVDKNNTLFIMFAGTDAQETTYRDIQLLKKPSGGNWTETKIADEGVTLTDPSTLYDPSFKLSFSDVPPTMYRSSKGIKFVGTVSTNQAPTVTLTSPSNNQTLYENDTFNINGTTLDTDNGNTVTIRYQINALTTRAIKAFLSDGVTIESFSKSLTFKGGNLYDGTTLIAENLSDGVAHMLKVWATDDQGGTSVIREIPFYVVPNRAPLLMVNSPIIEGVINSDKFTVNGTFEDSDGNTTIVSYRINGSTSVQVAEGVSGPFTFEVAFGQLVIGDNQIVVEAVDSYGAKVSKTIKLNKNEVKTDQLRSTARYKINPPTGSAKAVLLWIQRDSSLSIDAAISMEMQGEAEAFTPLTISNSVPLEQGSSIVEDEFYHEADGPKDNIIFQIDMERTSLEVDDKIYLISGVLD